MKTPIILSALLAANLFAAAQTTSGTSSSAAPAVEKSNYRTAIGLRAGETSGLTFKRFLGNNSAFEGIISTWPYALGVTALYEKHEQAFDLEGMKWYYGGGGHAIFETARSYYWYRGDRYFYYHDRGGLGLGIDGIVGLEYKIKPIPFAVSLDIKPFAEVLTDGGLYMSLDPGLGIKVAF